MKRAIAYLLYAVSALLDDVVFYLIVDENESTGIVIETHWCKHYY